MTWIWTFLFNAGFTVFGLFYLPFFILRLKQADKPTEVIRQRLGWLPPSWKRDFHDKTVIWVHAVSVGEVMAVQSFLKAFLNRDDRYFVLLTTVTPTGQRVASQIQHERLRLSYYPFDFTFSVRRFYDFFHPACVLLTETELWPNMIFAAKKRGVPIGVINGRLSLRSAKRYGRFRFLFSGLFRSLDFVLTQTRNDAERFVDLGVFRKRAQVLGNMKFDNAASLENPLVSTEDATREKWKLAPEDFVFVAGSTHANEEERLGKIFQNLKSLHPKLKMILAPRHVERSASILKWFLRRRVTAVLASDFPRVEAYDVLILNRLGVLKHLYQTADLVFVGGSLVAHGGQNPIEPAACKKAILHGPHIFNFSHVYETLDREGGALCVRDALALEASCKRLMSAPRERESLGRNADRLVKQLQGATDRHLEWITGFLRQDAGERNQYVSRDPKLLSTSGARV